jgi:hypothetical protein
MPLFPAFPEIPNSWKKYPAFLTADDNQAWRAGAERKAQ